MKSVKSVVYSQNNNESIKHTAAQRWAWLPSALTALRLASIPWLLQALNQHHQAWAIGLLLLAGLTDILDGHLARKLGVCSTFGAYFDVSADLALVLAAFATFARQGIYPAWTLLLIGAMFAQFVLTSRLGRPVYDPVGKYYGAFLLVGSGITVALPDFAVCYTLLAAILGLTLASLSSRLVSLLNARRYRQHKSTL